MNQHAHDWMPLGDDLEMCRVCGWVRFPIDSDDTLDVRPQAC